MPVLKKHFSLSPLNDNPLNIIAGSVISGGFSHRDGFPTIRFSVPSQMAMLETSTLHMVGQFIVQKTEDNTILDEAPTANTNLNNDSANLTRETCTNIPNWGGIKNCIDKVVVQSKKSQVELTSAINYAQYEGLLECYTHNKDDYLESPLVRGLSSGANADFVNRRVISAYDPTGLAQGTDTNDRNIGQFFSIRLNLDLLNNLPLNLANDYTGGLLITIHLNPDSQVFCNRFRGYDTAQVAQANAASQASYSLKNIKLEGRYIIPTQQEMSAYPTAVMLNSRLNLINDVQSSVNSNAYTPQLSMVKSMVNLYLDNDQTNNVQKNCNNFRHVVGEKANQQAKNGLRYPFDYKTEMVPNFNSSVERGTATNGIDPLTLAVPTVQMGDCEVRRQFEYALLGGKTPYHSSATIKQQNSSLAEDAGIYAGASTTLANNNMKPNCVGIGADYTFGMGNVQNFVNQDYNLTVESGVNTGNAKLPSAQNRNGAGAANPLLQQTFIRHLSPFNLQTLVKTM